MKTSYQFILLSLCAGLFSCTSEVFTEDAYEGAGGTTIKNITVTLPEIEGSEELATTRTEFVMDANGVKAHWAEGDTLGIFPANGDQVSFPITSGIESNTATFDGGDWGLKAGRSYAAYFPYNKWNIFRDNKSILLDYNGQVQHGNDNYDHLGAYDFLAAGQVSPNAAGYLTLNMERLGSIVMLQLTLPEACSPTELIINSHPVSNSEASAALPNKMILDISSATPSPRVSGGSSDFKLQLENVQLSSSNCVLTAYLMMAPYSYQSDGYFWTVKVNATNGNTYIADINTKDLEAGKPYKFTATMEREGPVSLPVLTNANLIAAAEASSGKQFTKNDDGTVTLDKANKAIVLSVESLDLTAQGDPTICDEIEYFESLRELYCEENQLTNLDISNNTSLFRLGCGNNQLTNLDVSNNTVLAYLSCGNNKLTSLDVSNNTALTYLFCAGNPLTSLDISNNTALAYLSCDNNQLTSLDVSNNTALTFLSCYNNQLTSLDVSDNTALAYLSCYNNQLTSLDVSNNMALIYLSCYNNQLTSLDISNIVKLELIKVIAGVQPGVLTLYVNETQSSQTLSTYMNENVIVIMKSGIQLAFDFTVTPTHETVAPTATKSSSLNVSLGQISATSIQWTTDNINGSTNAFIAVFTDNNGNTLFTSNTTTAPSSTTLAKVAKVYVVPNLNDWRLYEDNRSYNGTMTLRNGSGSSAPVVATINISMKKTLPTGAPAGYSVKTGLINNGILKPYLIPDSWAANTATVATMAMLDVFNMGTNSSDITSLASSYNITFANAAYVGSAIGSVTVSGDETLEIAKAFIDNATKHSTIVSYNYGKISSVLGNTNYTVMVDNFNTEFHSIYDATYSWHWMTLSEYRSLIGSSASTLPYNTNINYGQSNKVIDLTYIMGTSSTNSLYNAPLGSPYQGSLEVTAVSLTSNSNGKEEYFDAYLDGSAIKFTPLTSGMSPVVDVPSTLNITCRDMYGFSHYIKLSMTVVKDSTEHNVSNQSFEKDTYQW